MSPSYSPPLYSPLIIDPALFDPAAISAETAEMTAKIEQLFAAAPPIWDVGAPAIREARRRGEGLLAIEPFSSIAQWRTVHANGLDVPVRIFTPPTIQGAYLHIHGGGHTIGAADNQDQTLEALARAINIAVVSVEYRLAPEHPWPAGPDDCEAAATWLAENMQKEFGTNKLVIGGESAGAHLSATTLLRLRDHHGFTGFAGANLVYGVYDMAATPSARNWGSRNLIISTPIIDWFGNNLLPFDQYSAETRRKPEYSPLHADLTSMPPALFTIGTLDPLVDDTLFMAQRWLQTGAPTQLKIYPGGIHAFDALPITIAREARSAMQEFIGSCIED